MAAAPQGVGVSVLPPDGQVPLINYRSGPPPSSQNPALLEASSLAQWRAETPPNPAVVTGSGETFVFRHDASSPKPSPGNRAAARAL